MASVKFMQRRYGEDLVPGHGGGIFSENLPKLFDPFFTTRPPGNGVSDSGSPSRTAS